MKIIYQYRAIVAILIVPIILVALVQRLPIASAGASDLRVVSSTPADWEGNVVIQATARLWFDEELYGDMDDELVSLQQLNGEEVSVSLSVYGQELSVVPQAALAYDTTYELQLKPGSVESATGRTLTEAYTITFRTEAAPELVLLAANPANGQGGVPLDQPIELLFNRPVMPGNQAGGIMISSSNGMVDYQTGIDGNKLILHANEPLQPSVTYSVYMPAGSVMSPDHAQNKQAIALTFTTCQCEASHTGTERIDSNVFHSAMLKEDGTLLAWGFNQHGQLGNGTNASSAVPVQVVDSATGQPLRDISQVSVGYHFTLALKNDGTVWTWGINEYGQLGNGTQLSKSYPTQVKTESSDLLDQVVAVSAGSFHSLALKADGTVWSWGDNTHGQLGNGTVQSTSLPVQVTGEDSVLDQVIAIAAGEYHSVALRADGTVWTWGHNEAGSLGDGTFLNRLSPVQVAGESGDGALQGIVSISASYHTTALDADGNLWTWGYNNQGQLGDGTTVNRAVPLKAKGHSFTSASAGSYHTIALKADGSVWGWGGNEYNQLGADSQSNSLIPVEVGIDGGEAAVVSGGGYHSAAIMKNGQVATWGNNQYGQLGKGIVEEYSAPAMSLAIR
ncbi:Ig-like domain-containing protein [Paenibacillus sp. J5C_2022]|uniref:RCC1 domain-containing protein n=1 Tax=Paenibacillus sp. J5C2022 TaxID=2977129 RepID=UPI0021D1972F|nr:Ig-like domain-containing protein [Paenibacillus sp. J5C2022]MCU6710970.1 Ig-like domain-containing protein [Paenibacillus sp. J5C2022]